MINVEKTSVADIEDGGQHGSAAFGVLAYGSGEPLQLRTDEARRHQQARREGVRFDLLTIGRRAGRLVGEPTCQPRPRVTLWRSFTPEDILVKRSIIHTAPDRVPHGSR